MHNLILVSSSNVARITTVGVKYYYCLYVLLDYGVGVFVLSPSCNCEPSSLVLFDD